MLHHQSQHVTPGIKDFFSMMPSMCGCAVDPVPHATEHQHPSPDDLSSHNHPIFSSRV